MNGKELPKAYEPQQFESAIYKRWEDSGFFNPDNLPGERKKVFSIAMPPPNATGPLHIGHAVTMTVEDIMTRFARMRGNKTLWLPGTDHAAIATQNVVEKQLKDEGKTKDDIGREAFVKRVNEFVEESRTRIRQQIKAMGSSCDWSRERYTLDEGLSKAVQEMFIKMYKDNLIYRGERIVNWCPRCQSTLADDEVEYKEQKTPFYYFKYGPVIIGTARPETKFSDKVIIVHPDDKRYKHLHGKEIELEWIDGKIKAKVIADPAADPKAGSGAMTITPAHSFADFELAQKYNLSIEKIIDEHGKLTAAAGELKGMLARDARSKIVDKLHKKGLVDHIDENYVHNLSVCYRCGAAIEPLVSKQWFVSVDKPAIRAGLKKLSLKDRARQVIKKGEIKIIPKHFEKVYFHWMDNLHDWNISRQLWFGHRIPVWYCRANAAEAEKKMGFHESVVPQVYAGKTKTYRLRDYYLAKGEAVAFENSQTEKVFGQGTITNIEKTTVGKIRLDDPAHNATYSKLSELITAFKRHHPDKSITADTEAYIYSYSFIPGEENPGCGEIVVSAQKPNVCPHCKGHEFEQDIDVLDTWFSSALWTFSTLGWPEKTKDLQTFHPTTVMETGYDILFFWVARMILMTTYGLKQLPFKTVYLHGLVRDRQGRKMSKSLNNGIDPLAMSEKYSADAVRLSLVVGTAPGNDTKLYEEKIASYRNFGNKIWNIARYAMMSFDLQNTNELNLEKLNIEEKAILHKLYELTKTVTVAMENYSFGTTGEIIYDFIWHEFADVYLEETKARKTDNTSVVISRVLKTSLKLLHPFMPFVTEHIWQQLGEKELLMIADWPRPETNDFSDAAKAHQRLVDLVSKIRTVRSLLGISASQKISLELNSGRHQTLLKDFEPIILQLVRAQNISLGDTTNKVLGFTSGISFGWAVSSDERQHLKKEAEQLQQYVDRLKKKLDNSSFASRAPTEVVEQERAKLTASEDKLTTIKRLL